MAYCCRRDLDIKPTKIDVYYFIVKNDRDIFQSLFTYNSRNKKSRWWIHRHLENEVGPVRFH